MIPKFEKGFHSFVELVETNPLIYNTLHFDQYSRGLNIFRVLANNLKLKFEKSFPLVCRAFIAFLPIEMPEHGATYQASKKLQLLWKHAFVILDTQYHKQAI